MMDNKELARQIMVWYKRLEHERDPGWCPDWAYEMMDTAQKLDPTLGAADVLNSQ